MEKEFKAMLLALASLILIFTPFYLPDNYVYVEKCESVYTYYFNIMGYISIWILLALAIHSLYTFWYNILNKE